MIVNIRGTGGAGKSYIVREVMSRYGTRIPFNTEPPTRKRPLGYVCYYPTMDSLLAAECDLRKMFAVGHYETACGGGDTFKTPDEVFALASEFAGKGYDVIFEGIISQDDVTRTVELGRRFPLKIIALRVPIETCLAGIQARRDEREDTRPLNPKNTIARAKRLEGVVSRLRDANVDCKWYDRESGLKAALEAFGL